MGRMAAGWLLVLVVLWGGVARGQGLTKFVPDRPRLVINPKGPTSDIRAMLLSPDGGRLYVAGLDKVVQVYDVAVDPANPGRDRLVAGTTLRWEVSRGTKGAINAMALSPDGRRLYVAGIATRAPYGRIVIFDPAQRQIVGALPLDVPSNDPKTMDLFAHGDPVTSLSISPDGQRLASASADGEVRVWALDAPVPPNGQTPSLIVRGKQANVGAVAAKGQEITAEHRVLWVDNSRLVVTERVGAEKWVLGEYVVGAAGAQRSQAVSLEHLGGVTSLARSEDGFWASAERDGRVLLWTATRGLDQVPLPAPLALKGRATPTGLSFGGGLLSVCVNYHKLTYLEGAQREDSEVQVIRLRPFGLVQTLPTSVFGRTFASVLSADGGRLLSHISDADTDDPQVEIQKRQAGAVARAQSIGDEVVSFRLKGADGALRNAAEVAGTATLVRGRGLPVWHVAFPRKPGDYRIGFSQDGGDHVRQPDWAGRVRKEFDLAAGTLKQAANPVEWRQPVENGEAWDVKAEGRFVQLFRGRVEVDRLEFPDVVSRFTGLPYTVCLIPDATGKPVAIAVGTSTVNGIFVYQLPQGQGRRATLVRYYRDHFGKVNSLCASADGKYLVSGAADHTIKVWSLSGLLAPAGAFPLSRAWGCTFQIENGQLVVRNIDPAGIAAGRGFGEGDVVTKVYNAATRHDQLKEPVAMLRLLSESAITTELILTTQAAGKPARELAVVPAWEPMITLYVEATGEWAAFTPQGYFNSSAAEGPELFGWQINLGPATTPEFREGKELAKEFEREYLLKELFAQGTLTKAFEVVAKVPPGGVIPQKDVANVSQTEAPKVRITAPLDGTDVANPGNVIVKAEVTLPPGKKPADYRMTLTENGKTLASQQGAPREGPNGTTVVEVTGTAAPDSQVSLVEAVVGEKTGFPRFVAEDRFTIRSQQSGMNERYQLIYLGFGCAEYPKPSAENPTRFAPLSFTVKDIEGFYDVLGIPPEANRAYTLHPASKRYLNEQVTKPAFEDAMDRVKRALQEVAANRNAGGTSPEVLVLVHVTGHGDVLRSAGGKPQQFFFAPTTHRFLPDNPGDTRDDEDLRTHGIGWNVMEELAAIPGCRKLFLIDACHSGEVVKSIYRPVAEHNAIVFSATKESGELSYEHQQLEHGAFTHFWIQALQKDKVKAKYKVDGFVVKEGEEAYDDSREDGVIRLQEIETYVRFMTAQFVAAAVEQNQTPTMGPADLIKGLDPRIVFLKGVNADPKGNQTAAK